MLFPHYLAIIYQAIIRGLSLKLCNEKFLIKIISAVMQATRHNYVHGHRVYIIVHIRELNRKNRLKN